MQDFTTQNGPQFTIYVLLTSGIVLCRGMADFELLAQPRTLVYHEAVCRLDSHGGELHFLVTHICICAVLLDHQPD